MFGGPVTIDLIFRKFQHFHNFSKLFQEIAEIVEVYNINARVTDTSHKKKSHQNEILRQGGMLEAHVTSRKSMNLENSVF